MDVGGRSVTSSSSLACRGRGTNGDPMDGAGDANDVAVRMVMSSWKTRSSSPGEPIEVRPARWRNGERCLAGVLTSPPLDAAAVKASSSARRAARFVRDFEARRRGREEAELADPRREFNRMILLAILESRGAGELYANGKGILEGVSLYAACLAVDEDTGMVLLSATCDFPNHVMCHSLALFQWWSLRHARPKVRLLLLPRHLVDSRLRRGDPVALLP